MVFLCVFLQSGFSKRVFPLVLLKIAYDSLHVVAYHPPIAQKWSSTGLVYEWRTRRNSGQVATVAKGTTHIITKLIKWWGVPLDLPMYPIRTPWKNTKNTHKTPTQCKQLDFTSHSSATKTSTPGYFKKTAKWCSILTSDSIPVANPKAVSILHQRVRLDLVLIPRWRLPVLKNVGNWENDMVKTMVKTHG